MSPFKLAIFEDRNIWRKAFPKGHVIRADQFTPETLRIVLEHAERARAVVAFGGGRSLATKRIRLIFYEPSTRTSGSFESAGDALGASVMVVADPKTTSSTIKGENLRDTIRMHGQYSDLVVLRHPEDNSSDIAASVSDVPIINGGSGKLHHPTQGLLDLFTIKDELGRLEGLDITFVGDLKYGRTVQSLAVFMSFYGARLNFVSPSELRIPDALRQELKSRGISVFETGELAEVIGKTDVLYVTRVQKERFDDPEAGERLAASYCIPQDVYRDARPHMRIMHPLPRVNELPEALDDHPNSAYHRQAHNGVFVRMALLDLILVSIN